MKRVFLTTALILTGTAPKAETFLEDFSENLNPKRWVTSTWEAPHNSPKNKSSFSADQVLVKDGYLRLKLSQLQNVDGSITSIGSEIMTVAKFGYGTYTLIMKASSNEINPLGRGDSVSGSITGVASYLDQSETEIDIEMEGISSRSSLTQTTTWVDVTKDSETKQIPPSKRESALPHHGFHTYKYIWTPGVVRFYRNGVLIATHKKVVPYKPAKFLLNHWGTNDPLWGGKATPGVDRYVFIKRFTFKPIDGF